MCDPSSPPTAKRPKIASLLTHGFDIILFVYALLAVVSYFMFLADFIAQLAQQFLGRQPARTAIIVGMAVAVTPACLVDKITKLQFLSKFSLASLLFVVCVVFFERFVEFADPSLEAGDGALSFVGGGGPSSSPELHSSALLEHPLSQNAMRVTHLLEVGRRSAREMLAEGVAGSGGGRKPSVEKEATGEMMFNLPLAPMSFSPAIASFAVVVGEQQVFRGMDLL